MTAQLIAAAESFARDMHHGQLRKYHGADYVEHPLRCAHRAREHRLPAHAVAAAACHDVMEDCHVTYDELAEATDDSVASLVLALTNPSKRFPNMPRSEKKKLDRDWMKKQSRLVRQLKLIDRADNLLDMVNHADKTSIPFMKKYTAESRLLLAAIGERTEYDDYRPWVSFTEDTDPILEREAWAALRAVELLVRK